MRALLLTPVLGLSLVACTVGDTGGGGGDDVAATCGNNAIDPNETCDDGNTASGDGCSSSCQTEATPRLDVSVDKPTLATELASTNLITVTLTGADGFSGAVGLTATVVDPNDMPLADWTVSLDKPSVDVPLNGTATAVATLTIPSENKALVGSVKINATSTATLGTFAANSMVTAENQITVPMKLDGNGLCEYPAAGTMRVTLGSKVRWLNTATAGNITIHIETTSGQPNFKHQDDPGSPPNTAYVQTASSAGTVTWYCHAPGVKVNNLFVQLVP